ncbi:hypothetical protein KIPE111705_32285 [Kibdelosporangium persicum]|uniref:UDP-N-acetylglucosamine:LPS N-acetylglucosamine transferase n=1 Tax=Kibdelosporangium persicum TaxID=2698649 RepID=A0ABX2F8R6_9PSEU|nr:hypothetical protein [Kibdelosporangium persicum]NRN67707.1 UDP-N-acetylglucosamine:LPS N-acetylglucosamine transferase [Kibdelosporangium persicum]
MIEILTSGVALGVHVPGLVLADRLRERGAEVTVSVLERMLPAETLATTTKMKWAFHRDFRVALAGQRVARDASVAVPPDAQAAMLESWRARDVRRFVVFSGFWLPILEQYGAVDVDVCHVDSVVSPSFQKVRTTLAPREIWLANADRGTLPFSIPVTREAPIPWESRDRRLLVHGGGWGMGTYRERASELRAHGFCLDVVAYEQRDVSSDPGIRHFMIDPEWHPWLDDGYPPFGQIVDGTATFTRGQGHHGSFSLTRSVVATVSKPGGGTLLDSLWSATPAVLLEPFGAHEKRNAELWERLGFGISFDKWRASGFDMGMLEKLHVTLDQVRESIVDYSAVLAG